MIRQPALVLLAAVTLSGCGSTVQGPAEVGTAGSLSGPASAAAGDSGLQVPNSAVAGGQQQLPAAGTGPATVAGPTTPPEVAGRNGSIASTSTSNGKPGPLSIGFLNQNNQAINSEYGYHVTQGQDIDKALVRGINAGGGLAGHKLDAQYVEYSADSSSYATDIAAACQKFTVDSPVSVVSASTISTEYGFADCLQRKGVMELSSSWTDAHNLSNHPLLFLPAGSSFEHAYITSLNQSHASGYLTAKDHLGVVLEGCPEDVRAWNDGIHPDIQRLGIQVELTTLSCTGGIQDAGAASAAMKQAILKWQTAGVDRVMFVTIYESTLLVLFAPEATSQAYHPGYVLTSDASASSVASSGSFPSDQKPGLRGAGTLLGYDVDRPPAPTAIENRCLTLARSGGLQVSSSFDRETVFVHCASLLLIEKALRDSPSAPTTTDLRSTIEGLGDQALLPGLVDGRTQLTASRHDGAAYARAFGWQRGCGCLTYLGAAAPMSG